MRNLVLQCIKSQRKRVTSSHNLAWALRPYLSLLRSNLMLRPLASIPTRHLTTSNNNERVLYERSSDTYLQPRAALSLSWLSCVYSTWYAFDFLPSVNNSGIPELYVSPMVGTAGCTMTYLLAALGCLYVRQMVCKVSVVDGSVCVYGHSLPMMFPSTKPTEYKIGEVSLDYSSDDVKQLVDRLESGKADMTAYLPLKIVNHRLPMAIYISTLRDIQDQELFLDTLFYGTTSKLKGKNPKTSRKAKLKLQPPSKKRNAKISKRK